MQELDLERAAVDAGSLHVLDGLTQQADYIAVL